MSREKQLVKNTVIVAFGQICTKFISFFLLPLYTSLLTTEEYGIVDLLNTYIALLIPVFFFQMDQAIFRFLIDAREDEIEKKKLISSSIIILLLQSVIYIIFFLVIGSLIKNQYKYFLLTNVIMTMFSSFFLQICRGLGDNTSYSIGSLVTGSGTIILNVLFILFLRFGATGMLLASLIANFICICFIFIRKKIYKYISIKYFSKEKIKSLWKYSVPLIPNQLSWWIINASDRTIISFFISVASNGIYSAANKFSGIIITIFNIFNLTWAESASLYVNDKDNSTFFGNIFNITIKLFMSFIIFVIVLMPFVFNILIKGLGFAAAYNQIPILLVATLFNIIVALLGSVYVALKKTKEIAKTSVYAAIINIAVNILLIKFVGIYAASLSTLVAFLSMAIYRFIDVQKYIKIKLEKNIIFNFLVIISLVIPCYYFGNNLLKFIVLILTTIYLIIYNKNNFLYVLKKIFKKLERRKN